MAMLRLSLMLVVFVDVMGQGLILPIINTLLIDPSSKFLEAGTTHGTRELLYGLLLGSEGRHIIVLLLVCIVIAGIFGGLTVSRKIFLVQTVPALLTLLAMFL